MASNERRDDLLCLRDFVASRGQPRNVASELAQVRPRYMLPTRWIAMHELPKNANGKIDTRRVKVPLPERS